MKKEILTIELILMVGISIFLTKGVHEAKGEGEEHGIVVAPIVNLGNSTDIWSVHLDNGTHTESFRIYGTPSDPVLSDQDSQILAMTSYQETGNTIIEQDILLGFTYSWNYTLNIPYRSKIDFFAFNLGFRFPVQVQLQCPQSMERGNSYQINATLTPLDWPDYNEFICNFRILDHTLFDESQSLTTPLGSENAWVPVEIGPIVVWPRIPLLLCDLDVGFKIVPELYSEKVEAVVSVTGDSTLLDSDRLVWNTPGQTLRFRAYADNSTGLDYSSIILSQFRFYLNKMRVGFNAYLEAHWLGGLLGSSVANWRLFTVDASRILSSLSFGALAPYTQVRAITPVTGEMPTPEVGFATLWERKVSGLKTLALKTIKDANGDGHEDIFVISTTVNNGSLSLIDGKNGGIIRSAEMIGYLPLEALYIEEPLVRIAVAYSGGLKIYNHRLEEIAFYSTPSGPSSLRTFTGKEVVFTCERSGWHDLVKYSLETATVSWTKGYVRDLFTYSVIRELVLNSTRIIVLWTCDTWFNDRWVAHVWDSDGNLISNVDPFGGASMWDDSLTANYYNSTHFLYSRKTPSSMFAKLSKIVGNSETNVWNTQVWNNNGNRGFAVVDANQDGSIDVMAVIGGNLALLNGKDGTPVYTLSEVFASNVTDTAVASDVDSDGINEIVVHADISYLISFKQSSHKILWQQGFGSEGVETIQDINGDGFREVVAATGTGIICYIGDELDIIPPSANAGPDQVVNEDTLVQFDGSGSTDNKGVVRWEWTFTDVTSKTLTGMTPTNTFNTPGSYVVTLNVTDYGLNWDTDTVEITVTDITKPIADAGPDQTVLEKTAVTLHGETSTDNVGIVSYTWTFTDSTPVTLTGVNPSYTFNNIGSFQVTLNISDSAGNWDTDTVLISVSADTVSPMADAGSDQTASEDTLVTLDGSASSDNIGITTYKWTFTDGTLRILTGKAPMYTFDTPGNYVVTLNVSDAAGNWDIDAVAITVLDVTKPSAKAGADQVVSLGATVAFDASSSIDNVGIVNYEWSFGDGTTGIGKSTTHAYASPGNYTVTLTVKDAASNTATDTVTITVSSAETPLILILGGIIAAIGIVLTAVLLRRRKHTHN